MKQRIVNDRWALWVTDHVADWDAPSNYERERFASMQQHLHYGDTLFDIGSEHGWVSALYAREFVGPENIVLFEPTPEFWVNIRKTWIANGLAEPFATWNGFVGNIDFFSMRDVITLDVWPEEANSELAECPAMAYRSLADPAHFAQITIDSYVKYTEIMPKAITIDVEGAELLVLKGAKRTLLRAQDLHVWVSIHPDLSEKEHGLSSDEIFTFMWNELGYNGEHLATDHEQHWHFWRDAR